MRDQAAGAVLLAAVALALCVPLLGGPNYSPDAIEYASMARRLAEGQGLTTALKWQFFDHGPVVRPAAVERPVFYPLFGAFVIWLVPQADPLRALQAANALLAAASAVASVAAFRTVVTPPAAWLGSVFLILTPGFTQTATMALSDSLFLLLWLAALLLLPRTRSIRESVLYGVLSGLATLTRPNGVLLAPAFLLWAWRDRAHAARRAGAMLAAMLLVTAPVWPVLIDARAHGMRPAALVNFSVQHIREASWDGFAQQVPAPVEFMRRHPGTVLRAIGTKTRHNARVLVLLLGPLVLLPLLEGAVSRRSRSAKPESGARGAEATGPFCACGTAGGARWLRRVWLALALANLAFYSLSWVAAGAVRYLLPTVALLLPLVIQEGIRCGERGQAERVATRSILVASLVLFAGAWNAHRQEVRRRWHPAGIEAHRLAARWVEAVARPDDVVASNDPWMVHYLTRRPAVACPRLGPGADVAAFARTFRVRWVVLIARPGDGRVRHCLQHPAARLVWHQDRGRRPGVYLFAVSWRGPAS